MASNPPRKPGLGWTGVGGILLSAVLLVWALHDVRPAELREHFASVRVWPFIGMIVVATLVFPLRTVRWRYLLRLDGETLPWIPLWHSLAIGFMANNLLPARTGEIARAYAAQKLTGVKFSTAAATIAVERVLDGITLVTLLALAAAAGGFTADATFGRVTLGQLITGTALAFAGLLVVAFIAVLQQERATRLVHTVVGAVLPTRWAERIERFFVGLLEGLEALRNPRRFLSIAAWSFVVWGVNGFSFLLCVYAFSLPVPWSAAFVVQSLIAFGVAAPQAPGFFGAFEFASRITLIAYGVSPALAVSYALGYHISTFIPITLLGMYSLSRAHLHIADLRQAAPAPAPASAPVGGDPEGP